MGSAGGGGSNDRNIPAPVLYRLAALGRRNNPNNRFLRYLSIPQGGFHPGRQLDLTAQAPPL